MQQQASGGLSILLCAVLLGACSTEPASRQTGLAADPLEAPNLYPPQTQPFDVAFGLSADLNGDVLAPPAEPALKIESVPGSLLLSWETTGTPDVTRIYSHDPQTGAETLVYESPDTTARSLRLPSNTPSRLWYRQQYRVEQCSSVQCVSSRRRGIASLAQGTVFSIAPAVYLQQERYAEHIALNRDITVAVASLPVEGALEILLRTGAVWVRTQRLRLDGLPVSLTRTLIPTLSASGDTLALLIQDPQALENGEVRILERLGEAWFQTSAWPLAGRPAGKLAARQGAASDSVGPAVDAGQRHSNYLDVISLSATGNELLVHCNDSVVSFSRTSTGWSTAAPVGADDHTDYQPLLSTGLPARLLAATTDADMTRIFTLTSLEDAVRLERWVQSSTGGGWSKAGAASIRGFDTSSDLFIRSNEAGDRLIIAGVEAGTSLRRTPIMWRFTVDDTSPDHAGFSADPGTDPGADPGPDQSYDHRTDYELVITPTDSLRSSPAIDTAAELFFSADAALITVAIGWQASDSTAVAKLTTFRYQNGLRQWLRALELPDSMPALASQLFARDVVMSSDGNTLLIAAGPHRSVTGSNPPASNRVGEILVMH